MRVIDARLSDASSCACLAVLLTAGNRSQSVHKFSRDFFWMAYFTTKNFFYITELAAGYSAKVSGGIK
jgi:hypothetical protein